LSKENHVVRQLCEARHQLEPFRPYGFQFIQPGSVLLPSRQVEIGQGNGIEVVVRQRDKTKAQPAQLHDFLDHGIGSALPGSLAIGAPD
jgi:hypothetical protein